MNQSVKLAVLATTLGFSFPAFAVGLNTGVGAKVETPAISVNADAKADAKASGKAGVSGDKKKHGAMEHKCEHDPKAGGEKGHGCIDAGNEAKAAAEKGEKQADKMKDKMKGKAEAKVKAEGGVQAGK